MTDFDAPNPSPDNDQAAAGAPVVAVVSGRENMVALRDRVTLRAYLFTAESSARPRMQMTRNFTATIAGFNQAYGAQCRTWAQVAQCAHYLTGGK